MSNIPFLQVKNLQCIRGHRKLFQNLNFDLYSGEILQIVGENGAGKSSLLKILTGLFQNYQGQVLWYDNPIHENLNEYQQQLFYLGHQQTVKNELTVFENLYFDFKKKNISKDFIHAALAEMNLGEFLSHFGHHLSQGQRQRVVLTKLLLLNARLWILDEPFASLDVNGIQKVQEILQKKITQGDMVVLTSHQSLNLDKLSVKVLQL